MQSLTTQMQSLSMQDKSLEEVQKMLDDVKAEMRAELEKLDDFRYAAIMAYKEGKIDEHLKYIAAVDMQDKVILALTLRRDVLASHVADKSV